MFTVQKRLGLIAGVSALALILGGCSSGGGASPGVSSSAAAADVAGAKALAAKYLADPTSIGVTAPLSAKVPTGKKILALTNAPVVEMEADAMQVAAGKLGWDFDRVRIGSGAEDPQKAFELAISQKPDGIYYTGFTTATMQQQLTEAKAAGIVVVSQSLGEDTPPESVAQIRQNSTEDTNGELLGAQIVAASNGKAHVLYVGLPRYPVTARTPIGIQNSFDKFCPGCTVTQIQAEASDIGTNLPNAVVSELQRDPTINYIAFNFGDMTTGVQAAIDAASLTDQATIVGATPNNDNLTSLKSGGAGIFVDNLGPQMGWQVMDVFARAFLGDDVTVQEGAVPTQILTKDNIGAASIDGQGYWYAPSDYQEQYAKLWGLG
ncbi:MAG: ribose transport system substrate-binding protein [Subtercola sp.]|nr:ribose transport system substrate-binding protein [Subtercola sp.]